LFKPTSPKMLVPVPWPVAVGTIAVALLAAAGVLGSATLRTRSKMPSVPQAAALLGPATVKQSAVVRASLATLPLAFEANQGQTDPQVKYMARGSGYTAFFTASDTVFALHSSSPTSKTRISRNQPPSDADQKSAKKNQTAAVRMRLLDSNPHPRITADSQLPGRSNYFIGNDPSQWHANVPQYARISYRDVYPGINMAYYGAQKQLEFDFIVAPGASPAPIRLGVSGANRIATDKAGNLILSSSAGEVLLHKPIAYQRKDGSRNPVDSRFVLQARNQVTIELANYDHTRELVIDPSVSYATYLGGTAEDDGNAIAIDSSGNAYVTGQTKSTDFPTKSALYGTNKGGFDVFVTKLSGATGSLGSLVYSTYIGGTGDDSGNAIALDASGNIFVAGGTKSSDFPTQGAYQSTLKGATNAFVLELNSTGSTLMYSTFLGGTGTDVASGLALDSGGNAYVVGSTTSTDFPPQNPLPSQTGGGFVTELNSSGNALVYSTYLGAGTNDFAAAVAVDGSGDAYVTGASNSPTFKTTPGVVQPACGTDGNCNGALYDAYVSVIKAGGGSFVYSTFLGGGKSDQGLGIAVDSAGDAYVTGLTQSSDFPTKNPIHSSLGGLQDAFVTELNPTGSAPLVYSTYLGGSNTDGGAGIAIDVNKNVYVTGQTASTDFPVSANATQSTSGGGNDAFVAEINSAGSQITFATYLGGALNENSRSSGSNFSPVGAIAVDSAGANIYVAGNTMSSDFPKTSGANQTTIGSPGIFDAFVAKYSLSSTTGGTFTVTNGPLSPTSGSPGVSATATITVTSVSGFNGTVNLACSVSPVVSKGPTCSFSPGSSVNLSANGNATATLNVATTAASAMIEHPVLPSGLFYAMLLPVGGITLLGARIGSSAWRGGKLLGFVMLGLVLTALLLLPACSSSKSGGGSTGTPPGTYTITVTGTSGSTVTGTPALTLTVN
jgi:Beta-propeller repeat